MRFFCLTWLFVALSMPIFSQQNQTNESIEKLAKAGLSDDVIISAINNSPGTYDTSPDGLIALKSSGVSDKVVAAVLSKSNPSVTAGPSATTGASTSPVPAEVDSEGVYYKDKNGSWQEVPAEVVNVKTGGVIKHISSLGWVKGDLNGHIAGSKSKLAITFPVKVILDVPEGRSPGEYQLLRLRVGGNYREFRSVTGGVLHETTGASRDDIPFSTKKLAPHIYEVTLQSDIGKGEYGFLPPLDTTSLKNVASSGKIYSFSISE